MPPKIEIPVGAVFAKLTVLGQSRRCPRSGLSLDPHAKWRCKCECGKIAIVRGAALRSGDTKSCGCIAKTPLEVGRRFGRLVVVEEGRPAKDGKPRWRCRCDCGKSVNYRPIQLKRGQSTSCGCGRTRHGKSTTTIYKRWLGMLSRCYNPFHVGFEHYGGRGITAHPSWRGRGGFERFLEHVGPLPTKKHQLDRIEVNGNYEPGNVRWATASDNQRNRRPAPRFVPPIGTKFDAWTVLGEGKQKSGGRYHCLCVCVCGKTREVAVSNLKKGSSGSCGCRRGHRGRNRSVSESR